MAAAPGPSEMEVQLVRSRYVEQGKVVRAAKLAVKTGTGTKPEVDAEIAKLLEIKATHKALTGEEISLRASASAPAAVAANAIAESPPSPALFLDIYPTGSDGHGVPMCVSTKLAEQVAKRDPDDSGFDLPAQCKVLCPPHTTTRIKLGVRATLSSVIMYQNTVTGVWEGFHKGARRKPYWLAPRSSLSKTPLILHNSIGVIDSGYNGELQAAVYNTSDKPYQVEQLDRLVQIVAGDLTPFHEIRIRGMGERPGKTARGDGAYGSTGK